MINFWEMNVSEILDVPYSLIAALQISLFVRSVPEADVVCSAIILGQEKSRSMAAYMQMMHSEVFNNIKPFVNRGF